MVHTGNSSNQFVGLPKSLGQAAGCSTSSVNTCAAPLIRTPLGCSTSIYILQIRGRRPADKQYLQSLYAYDSIINYKCQDVFSQIANLFLIDFELSLHILSNYGKIISTKIGGNVLADKVLDLGKVEITKAEEEPHVPSKVQADTLFTFTSQLEFLMNSLKKKMLSPRYCAEDIRYLNIPNFEKLAFPMRCFCDINMHRLGEHLAWYGYYGLAFSKEWGMKNCIQPIQYINPKSHLREDFSEAFSKALSSKGESSDSLNALKNYLLHELMYWKPYQGKFKNRNTQENETKCFTDECEWRFVPDVTVEGFDQVLFDKNKLDTELFYKMSNAMDGLDKISLKFEYSDIKYIIVKNGSDFVELSKLVSTLTNNRILEHEIVSKIIIWDKSGGDF